MPTLIGTVTTHAVRITDDGKQVIVITDGRACEYPAERAIEVARAMLAAARKVMELRPQVAAGIIADEALLLRAGAPLSLSAHPAIRAEAEKVAQHDRALRRYLPGGVRSETHVAAPVVRCGNPAARPTR